MSGLSGQLARFGFVGAVAVSIDFAVYRGLAALVGHPHVCKGVSFVLATIVAYWLNRRWTFGVQGHAGRLAGFMVLYACTFVVNVGVNALMLALLPVGGARVTGAFLVAQATSTAINFVMLRVLIFRASSAPSGTAIERDVQVKVLR